MKNELLLSLIFVLLCGLLSGQHLKRVNNNPGADPDYATLQAANDAASNGDTIYVEGSPTDYDGADISKKLVIIGPGYFLTDNDSTQAFGIAATFNGVINFNAGSEGSIITGCNLNTNLNLSANDISIIRCNVSYIYNLSDVDNILILQNYVNTINMEAYFKVITNSVISNNIIGGYIHTNSSSGNLQIANNVCNYYSAGAIAVYNASIANNIITNTSGTIAVNTGNAINNNILAGAGTNANGNLYNVVMANVFVDFSGSLNYSDDAKWKLKAGSPAIGAGVSGVDCGAFGGPTPYVLSGVPNLPHIYEATIPGTAYSNLGLACTIKIKSGK